MSIRSAPPPSNAGGFPWLVVERAGTGATSVVFRATHVTTGQAAALKVATCVGYLRTEAEVLARVPRRWGPPLLDAGNLASDAMGCAKGASFVATEWVEGTPLDPVGPLSNRLRTALIVAHGVGNALSELHAAGVRHGDVKPANIIVTHTVPSVDTPADRGATLIDLGLADTQLDAPLAGGTPRYLSPEVRAASGPPGLAADLYALGLVLLELLDAEAAAAPDLDAYVKTVGQRRSISVGAPTERLLWAWTDALLSPHPGGRPAARWIAQRAARAMGLAQDPASEIEERELDVRRAYFAARGSALSQPGTVDESVTMPARQWLEDALAWSFKLQGAFVSTPDLLTTVQTPSRTVPPLSVVERERWVAELVGPTAASLSLSALPVEEGALALRLLELARTHPPAAWTQRDLDGDRSVHGAPIPQPSDPEWLVRATVELTTQSPSPEWMRAVEDAVLGDEAPQALAVALARALMRRGELGRAAVALSNDACDDAQALLAEIARRRGDAPQAIRLAERVVKEGVVESAVHRARATLGRIHWDRGDDGAALDAVRDCPTAAALEVRALVAWRSGETHDVVEEIQRAMDGVLSGEDRARLEGIQGLIHQARGDSELALGAFLRATDHAARAGALLEEATYSTSTAAAAVDAGAIGHALRVARRAALLWERLGRPQDAAHAWLALAAAAATVGAVHEADEAATQAATCARSCGDVRTEAFAAWARVEGRAPGDDDAKSWALRAWELLGTSRGEDRVRAAARLLVWAEGTLSRSVIAELDGEAEGKSVAAQLDWWGARAYAIGRGRVMVGDDLVVTKLVALADAGGPVVAKGVAMAFGVRAAEERGQGDAARKLDAERRRMARIVRAKTPSAYLPAFAQVDWARAAEGETGAAFDPAQVARLESLVRALGERENLKALLGQVLDALLLWTGVERGLLLLCAPDGRLVPRAARNLGRHDLEGEQLVLSQSIARRALEIRDAVVATDAYSSLGDVHASVHALRLRSVLAVPLVARGDALGVVYLDDRVRRGAFGENELAWVRVLSAQAALAIADARDQALLRRANRRAERAQKKLLTRLAHADAELDATRIQLAQARDESQTRYAYDAIVGRSEPMQELLRVVDRVTPVDVPVLLVGESGTGKELIARAIHENGPRSARPFVGENCGAVPEPLLESTLFGHVRGAFTGAVATRAGLFEVADGGTLFLDEIGEMPLAMQTKLLRVLQDGEVRPVGSEKARKVNVRIVAATHRDLSAMAQEGLFREDLLYRLSVIVLRVPPLRERRDDIPLLVASFLDRHGGGQGQVRISRAALDRLVAYPWPGNVRQLENEVRRAIVLSDGRIEEEHLSPALQESARASVKSHGLDLRSRIDALEVDLLREALRKTQGNQTKAAALLGVSRYGLQKMIKRLNVRVPS